MKRFSCIHTTVVVACIGLLFLALPGAAFATSVKCTLAPAGAIAAGAQWSVDNSTLCNSGCTVTRLAAGWHIVYFSEVHGWTAPAPQYVYVNDGQTTSINGAYTPGKNDCGCK